MCERALTMHGAETADNGGFGEQGGRTFLATLIIYTLISDLLLLDRCYFYFFIFPTKIQSSDARKKFRTPSSFRKFLEEGLHTLCQDVPSARRSPV